MRLGGKEIKKAFREYRHLRKLSRSLNSRIIKTLSHKDMMAGAKKLGMLQRGVLVAGCEEELDVMMDYSLYSIYHGGMNTIQRYLKKAETTGEELNLLQAMVSAWYSVFQIIGRGKGYVTFKDIFSSSEHIVMDKNMSESATMGLMLAVRLIPCGAWCMTSGTGIPINRETFGSIEVVLIKFTQSGTFGKDTKPFSHSREASFSAQIIRALLRADALGRMSFED